MSTVKSERDELQRQLAAARAELAAERERANTAEASVIHLRARLELEKAAYVSKADEAKYAKQERLSVVKQAKLTEKELKNERETKANMEAEFLKRSEDAAAQARAAAFAEASELAESRFSQQVRGLKHDLTSAKEAADEASKALRKATQKGPKVYTDDEIDELTNNAQRQVRFKERKFFRWLVEGRKWRMANIVGTMKDLGWLDELWDTAELQAMFMEKLQDLTAILEGVHFGVNFGLWLHLIKKLPSRLIRELRQAGCEKYSEATDKYKRKPWYVNPRNESDVVYVPFICPAPTAFAEEIDEYSETHGLNSNPNGTCAMQRIDLLVPHVLTRDMHRQPSFKDIGKFEVLIQGDAARRGIKMFSQWVFKNIYLDSQSCKVLHLIGLGVGCKDDQEGTIKLWGDQYDEIVSIHDKTWMVPTDVDDPDNSMMQEVETELCCTVDFHAEKDLFGVIGGGCMCQGGELQHRVPADHRSSMPTIESIMDWVSVCKEPKLNEQLNLAHMPRQGESLPRKCTQCGAFSGTQEEVAEAFETECNLFQQLFEAAKKSDKGRDAFNAKCLDHAHKHSQVRWNRRGIPLAYIPKERVYLELLHTLALNAAKIQIKHAAMKFYPDDLRDEAHRLFAEWGIKIDMRPAGKRTEPEKWPGGGVVVFLIEGGNGKCPVLAYVGAKLTFMMADYELKLKQKRTADAATAAKEVERAMAAGQSTKQATAAAASKVGVDLFAKPGTKKKGAAAMPLTGGATKAAGAKAAGTSTEQAKKPTEVETIPLQCQSRLVTAEDVAMIKQRYGLHLGQRTISTLLSYETFRIAWRTAKKRLPVPSTQEQRSAHATAWFHDWADWVEAIERVGNHDFKSWVPHRILHKGTRQIYGRGDLWARSTSALEANQSEMGRTLDKVSSKRRSIDVGDGKTQRPFKPKAEVEDVLDDLDTSHAVDVSKMKVTAAMAQTAVKHFIASQAYSNGKENVIKTREIERLTVGIDGRATKKRGLAKLEKVVTGVDKDAGTFIHFKGFLTETQIP